MKLYAHIKNKPEDFVVEEVPKIRIEEGGRFEVFKLEKCNVSTLEALRIASKKLRIPLKNIGFAGLKDKYALTVQYLTAPKGLLPKNFSMRWTGERWVNQEPDFPRHWGFKIKHVGYSVRPMKIGDVEKNIFKVRLRNFEKNMRKNFYKNMEIAINLGFPNYFGEQRFGSVKGRQDFVLKYLLKGDYETALKIYFLGREGIEFWGRWDKIYSILKGSLEEYEKDLILGLKRGLTAEKAFKILPKNVRLMFNFAFQSYIWNEVLRSYIERKYPFRRVTFINNWKLSFYRRVYDIDYLKQLSIPYTGKTHEPKDRLLRNILKKTFRQFGLKDDFFEKEIVGIKVLTDGLRKAIVFPENFKILEKTKDGALIKFSLPSGSYATVLLRMLLS